MPHAMLRLLPTPMTSAFLPSRRPIAVNHPRCRAATSREFSASRLQRTKFGGGESHEELGVRLPGNRYDLQRSESGLLVRSNRGDVFHRWPDHTHVDAVEWERQLREEPAEHRGPVTAPEQLRLTDEDVHADRLLAEIESLGILVGDPIVLDQAGGSLIDQGDVAVRRVAAPDRL